MRIVQAVWGVFHHFDLARELERRGHLERVYSTFPWARLKREGLAHSKVLTFPWFHMANLAAAQYSGWAADQFAYPNTILFEDWLNWHVPRTGIDALIALSGAGLKTGKRLQKQGGVFVCDRGSTHQRYQWHLIGEELKRWGIEPSATKARHVLCDREVAIYEIADAITVPSTFAARSFIESGIPKEKVHVIPYGVRLERFHSVAEPPSDTFEVLFVGQVGLRKGVPYLLQAFAGLRHPRKKLTIVGPVSPDLHHVLERLPQDQVEFAGSQPQTQVARYMSSSHVMVLPSIEEGLALVQGQALACGCPVIASTNTGSEDLFSDGVEGFIVPIRDPDALRARMQQLADDPQLQLQMREAALKRVRDLCGWQQYGDSWVSLLETMLQGNRVSGIQKYDHLPGKHLEDASETHSIQL
jgi:glycosyltransferase involved in cell wall biosynthesis